MKANQKVKQLREDTSAYTKMVGGIVSLLLVIIISVLVFWSVSDSVDSFNEVDETFTGYSHGDNASAQTVELDNSPNSESDTNVTCYSSTAGTLSYPTFSVNQKDVTIAAGSASNYTQVNVTYTSNMGTDATETEDMASTVYALAPIVALVIVASIILAVVMGFGGGKKGGL